MAYLRNIAGQIVPLTMVASGGGSPGEARPTSGTPSVFVRAGGNPAAAGLGAVTAFTANGDAQYTLTADDVKDPEVLVYWDLAGFIGGQLTINTFTPATVYFDSVNGTATGSGLYDDPISTVTAALDRLADWGARHLVLLQGEVTVPAGRNISGLVIEGAGLDVKVTLNNRPADGTTIRNCIVDGQQLTGRELTLEHCSVDGVLTFNGLMTGCVLNGTITIGTQGTAAFMDCVTAFANNPPVLDFAGVSIMHGTIAGWCGPLRVDGIGVATFLTHINLEGTLTFESGCTNNAAGVTVTGAASIVDNSGANFVFVDATVERQINADAHVFQVAASPAPTATTYTIEAISGGPTPTAIVNAYAQAFATFRTGTNNGFGGRQISSSSATAELNHSGTGTDLDRPLDAVPAAGDQVMITGQANV